MLKNYKSIFCCSALLFIMVFAQAQTKRYIKPTATGTGDGSSWANASADLQTIITASAAGDSVFVAKGSYKRSTTNGVFTMKEGVKIYGSFQGTESSLNDRVFGAASTDSSILTGNGSGVIRNNLTLTAASILDGFSITGGSYGGNVGGGVSNTNNTSPTLTNLTIYNNIASSGGGIGNTTGSNPTVTNVVFNNNTASNSGGGMLNQNSSPVLNNVTFSNNTASISTGHGGGMYNSKGSGISTPVSSPILTNVTFTGNSAYFGGAMSNNSAGNVQLNQVAITGNTATVGGGGIYNAYSTYGVTTLTNVTISGNTVTSTSGSGGGMDIYNSNPVLNMVTISGNKATKGGGMYINYVSAPVLTNVLITGNVATKLGGGIDNENQGSPTLTNVTIAGNYAGTNGGAMYNITTSSPIVRNSIIYGNNTGIFNVSATATNSPKFYYSLIQGSGGSASWAGFSVGTNGGNNIDTDPVFETAITASATPTTAGDFHLSLGSPAIDVGNNAYDAGVATDIQGNARIQNFIVNMGAYESLGIPLPVGLVNFNAVAKANTALLSWQTASEVNNKFFILSRSTDGIHFTDIATVASQGNSTKTQSYSFVDNAPGNGINYYRLSQQDNDGHTTILSVKTATFTLANMRVKIYPNPTKGQATVSFTKGLYQQALLFDMRGAKIQQKSIDGNTSAVSFNLTGVAKGIYIISLHGTGGNEQVKIIKD